MAKRPTINTLTNTASPTYLTQLNQNFTNVQTQFDNTLSLDGSTPNAMNADIDLNGNDLLNAGSVNTATLRIGGVQVSPNTAVAVDAVETKKEFTTVAALLADTSTYTFFAADDYVRVLDGNFVYKVAASGASDHHVTTAGGVKLSVQAGNNGRARIEAFGCILNGTTDDTAAFQKAMDSGLRLCSGKGTLKLTDTILLNPGADFEGAGGVANYADAALKIRFEPLTKRGVFVWRTAPVDYVFAGVRLTGFCVRGFGAGVGVVLDLPYLYNGYLDFFAFSGIDAWLRLRRWMDTDVRGGCQGFSAFGIEFSGAGVDPADVTTTTTIDAYISQGPIGYIATDRAVTDCKISGVVESVDNACSIARGNILWFDVYTENVPRTDAGAAWVYGKSGAASFEETALHLNLRPGIGYTGGTPANATLLDVGAVRYLRVSGYAYLYAKLLTTTQDTRAVSIVGLDTDNIPAFSSADGISSYGVISAFGFKPRAMEKTPGIGYFLDGSALTPNLELWPRTIQTVTRGQMFVDADFSNKLRMRDDFGNFSDPIPRLSVSGNSGWTIQGGRLTPGETVRNSLPNLGEVALWQSMRHSRDTAQSVAACSTTNGSAIVTKSAGAFNSIDVGDWVTASAGYPSATDQYRVIAKASNGSTITLDTNASSTVAGTVTVATEAHQLVPLAQQGFRSYGADPVGVLVPKFLGEDIFRSDNSTWYRSTGLTSSNWKLMT